MANVAGWEPPVPIDLKELDDWLTTRINWYRNWFRTIPRTMEPAFVDDVLWQFRKMDDLPCDAMARPVRAELQIWAYMVVVIRNTKQWLEHYRHSGAPDWASEPVNLDRLDDYLSPLLTFVRTRGPSTAGLQSSLTGEDAPLPRPKQYAVGWAGIAATLEQSNDEAFPKRIKSLHAMHPSPISFGGRGTPPRAEKRKLLEWWNSLDQRFDELMARKESRTESTSDSHGYGKDGTVIPEIGGSLKPRRQAKSTKFGRHRKTKD